jgi:hypothetical protein
MKEILTTGIKAYQDAIEFIESEGCEDFEVIRQYLKSKEMMAGLCNFIYFSFYDSYRLFESRYLMDYFMIWMCQPPKYWLHERKNKSSKNLIENCLQPRLDFLQSKLVELETTY